MRESTLFWGLLAASLTNVLCLCGYLESCWSLGWDEGSQGFSATLHDDAEAWPPRPSLQAKCLQAERALDLGNTDKDRNFRPVDDDHDAENHPECDQQRETRRPAVMLVFVDVAHARLPGSELKSTGTVRVLSARV